MQIEKKKFPDRSMVFIHSPESTKRKEIRDYASAVLYKLVAGNEIVYLSGVGSAIKDVTNLAAIFQRGKVVKPVYYGIGSLTKEGEPKPHPRLVIGLSQKNIEPKFEFID